MLEVKDFDGTSRQYLKINKVYWLRVVNNTTESDSLVSLALLSLTPWYHWHCWVWLHGVIGTAEMVFIMTNTQSDILLFSVLILIMTLFSVLVINDHNDFVFSAGVQNNFFFSAGVHCVQHSSTYRQPVWVRHSCQPRHG